ncbi:hypothetical protein SAMN02745116_01780 [Pilibacter termitis]|uniref:Phage protein n=1 Tax=Pilibacter termitis TaxID=263852 RepID=A0A1T4PE33_9ENTE|nr:hypothetical protein [Pilibacter termitis]SJZ89825.1 hypothetical protein SAMN02745116_01780 [Pilibacter termitis]
MSEISERLKGNAVLSNTFIKAYIRPETLSDDVDSITIAPLEPIQNGISGSDRVLTQVFAYQINAESKSRLRVKEMQRAVSEEMRALGFVQQLGGLDEYFEETGRYVDARRFRGSTKLYETNY